MGTKLKRKFDQIQWVRFIVCNRFRFTVSTTNVWRDIVQLQTPKTFNSLRRRPSMRAPKHKTKSSQTQMPKPTSAKMSTKMSQWNRRTKSDTKSSMTIDRTTSYCTPLTRNKRTRNHGIPIGTIVKSTGVWLVCFSIRERASAQETISIRHTTMAVAKIICSHPPGDNPNISTATAKREHRSNFGRTPNGVRIHRWQIVRGCAKYRSDKTIPFQIRRRIGPS